MRSANGARPARLLGIAGCLAFHLSGIAAAMAPGPFQQTEGYFGKTGALCAAPGLERGTYAPHALDSAGRPPSESDGRLLADFVADLTSPAGPHPERYLSHDYLGTPAAVSCVEAARTALARCFREPPALLGDLEIRVDWDCGRIRPYILFFTISSGRISDIWSSNEITTPDPGHIMETIAITSEDYPPEALRNHWEGRSGFHLDLAPDGSVARCTITHSSGHAVLDDAACTLVTDPTRFKPAHDGSRPAVGWHYDSAVVWQIPRNPGALGNPPVTAEAMLPKGASDYYLRGEAYLNQQEIDKAIADFDTALAIEPNYVHAQGSRGVAYAWKGAHAEALRDLGALGSAEPGTAVEYRGRGLLAQVEGRNREAYDYFTRALAIGFDPFAIGHRAEVDRAMAQNDHALADSEAALKLDPRSPILYQIRADILHDWGRTADALAEADRMVAAVPDSNYAWAAAGRIYAANGNIGAAQTAFQRALAISPAAFVYVARAQSRMPIDVTGRASDISAALRLDPGDKGALAEKTALMRTVSWPGGH